MERGKLKKKRRISWKTRCKLAATKLPREKRQEFLDYMWQGMTIGEAKEKAGVTFEEANGIIMLNMKSALILNRESV